MDTHLNIDEADWIANYLKKQSKLPLLSEMSMGSLRMAYSRHRERRWPELIRTDEQYYDWKRSRNYTKSSHQIANHLDNREDIEIRGEKRGKTYRHIDSRPIFTDQLIAKIIPTVLLQHNAEITWSELFPLTLQWLKICHKSFEKHPDFLPNVGKAMQAHNFPMNSLPPTTIIRIEESGELKVVDGRKTVQLGLKMNIDESKPYRKEFPADLDLWIDSTYSDEWWGKSSSNIQSLIKKAGEVESGSKRGTWKRSDLPGIPGTRILTIKDPPDQKSQMVVSTTDSYILVEAIISKLKGQINDHIVSIDKFQGIAKPHSSQNLKFEIRRLRDIEDSIDNMSKSVLRFREELEESDFTGNVTFEERYREKLKELREELEDPLAD